MTDDEIIAVVQAHKEGKQIECRPKAYVIGDKPEPWRPAEWYAWNFAGYDYRVKPEPRKPREWWIAPAEGRFHGWIIVLDEHRDSNCIRVREVIEE